MKGSCKAYFCDNPGPSYPLGCGGMDIFGNQFTQIMKQGLRGDNWFLDLERGEENINLKFSIYYILIRSICIIYFVYIIFINTAVLNLYLIIL